MQHSPSPFNKGAKFPLPGSWKEVGPEEVDRAINDHELFVIEAILEADGDYPEETGWAYRNDGSQDIIYEESESITFEVIISGPVDAYSEAIEVNGFKLHLMEGGPAFRFFLPA